MTEKQEQKLNAIMKNWWNGNISDAQAAIRNLQKRELAQLLVNQHQLKDGAWHQPNVVKFQDFVVDALA